LGLLSPPWSLFSVSVASLTFTISRAQKKIGSLAISVRSDGRWKEFVSAFG